MKRIVDKGWGKEIIFADHKNYCGKLMVFDYAGAKFSMHFHAIKEETWYVQQGSFIVIWIDTINAKIHESVLKAGDTWHNPINFPHQLEALEDNSIIFEVSTHDDVNDNYRIIPGDSQK